MRASQVRRTGPSTSAAASYNTTYSVSYQRASQCLGHLALPQVTLGVLATLAGIVTVFIASVRPSFPFYVGADMWSGVLNITAGGVAYRIHSETTDGKICRRIERMVVAYGFLTIACLCLGIVSLTLAGYVAYICSDDYVPSDHCLPRKRANLALSILDIVIESFIIVTSLLCFCKFSSYRYRFKPDVMSRTSVKPEPSKTRIFLPESSYVRDTKKDMYVARNRPASQHSIPMYGLSRVHGASPYIHTRPPQVHVSHVQNVHARNGYFSGRVIPLEKSMPPPYTSIAPY